MSIRPHQDILVDALKHWTAQLQLWIDTMERSCKLKIERSVIFREHVLTVRLFSHLDIGNRVTAFFPDM